jgi:type IV pilus assembly protein PilQ
LKTFLSKRGNIIADDRTNAVIIQDIPTVLPNLDRLIKELDRKTQEVEIEARVVAATRSFARDLGTQVGFSWGNGPTTVSGTPSVGVSPNGIPLFSSQAAVGPTSGLNFLNLGSKYRLDAILTAAESRGLLKILSRPRVVTQNNIQALVRQGVRIPVVTAAQLGGPPTTTYVDAFLRLQVQPQITSEGTIFLNVDVENTTPDFGRQVQGNPTLITQQATTQVLVADGGTVVIGGVIQVSDNLSVTQVPLLGNVPVFGNLFKRKTVSTSTQELIFFITPRIVQT